MEGGSVGKAIGLRGDRLGIRRRTNHMLNRPAVALFATIIVVSAACGGNGATTAPTNPPVASTAPATVAPPASTVASQTAGCSVGVSWNNFQQPRWAAHDKPGIQTTVTAGGGTYIDKDANLSSEQQATDIQTMVNQGVNVLIRTRPRRSPPSRQPSRPASRSSPMTA
jgi:ABC-type sugar transport system substrate-binding protein